MGDVPPLPETVLTACRHMLRAENLPIKGVHYFRRDEENWWFKCHSLFLMNVTEYGISVGCYDWTVGERVAAALEEEPPLSERNRNAICRTLGATMEVRHALHDYRACVDATAFQAADIPDGCRVERLAAEDIRDAWAKEWRTFGIRLDGQIVADGSVLDHEDTAHPISEIRRVATLAEYRNRGLAKAVVSGCVRDILSRGRIPIYRADVKNAPSLRVAESLGFHRYCESFEVLGVPKTPPMREGRFSH